MDGGGGLGGGHGKASFLLLTDVCFPRLLLSLLCLLKSEASQNSQTAFGEFSQRCCENLSAHQFGKQCLRNLHGQISATLLRIFCHLEFPQHRCGFLTTSKKGSHLTKVFSAPPSSEPCRLDQRNHTAGKGTIALHAFYILPVHCFCPRCVSIIAYPPQSHYIAALEFTHFSICANFAEKNAVLC